MRAALLPHRLPSLLLSLAWACEAQALTITIRPEAALHFVFSHATGGPNAEVTPEVIPSSGSVVAPGGGSASSTTTYDLSSSGFTISFDQARGTADGEQAIGTVQLPFSLDANVEYEISGHFTAADPDGRSSFLLAGLGLFGSGSLYRSEQASSSTPNESFVVGGTGGDQYNILVGSSTGILLAGVTYIFRAEARLHNDIVSSSPATGTGSVTLTFVPEPSTGLLLGAGLAAFALHRRSARDR